MVFYVDELRYRLKEAVVKGCPNCNQDIAGNNPPRNHPHTCQNVHSMRQAYDQYGDCATTGIAMDNPTRWKICRTWWDWVYDLPSFSSIKEKDAISFANEVQDKDVFGGAMRELWKEEFNEILERFSWTGAQSCHKLLCDLSLW